MKKTLYILLATLCCSMLSFAQDNKESIILKSEGKALDEIVLSIRAEGEVSIQGANSVKVDEQGRYVCVLPYSDDPEGTLTISAPRILGLTLDQIVATSLDLRHASSLTHLDCGSNGGSIRGLDLSSLENLVYLNCSKQEIALLDLEKNEKLETLLCSENKLSELDVQHLKQLKRLECSKNLLTKLDLRNLKNMEFVKAECNKISSLKIDGLINLKECYMRDNPLGGTLKINFQKLSTLDVSFCGLESLALVSAPKLQVLLCADNKLSSLSFANTPDIVSIDCYHNKINGEEMRKMIEELPNYSSPTNSGNGKCYAVSCGVSVDDPDEMEGNFAYENDIREALSKQWIFYAKTKDGKEVQYAGRPLSAQQVANTEIVISPNPATDFVFIQGVSPNTEVRILDLSGKLLIESLCRSDGILNLDVRTIPEGNYLIVINGSSQKLAIVRQR